MSKFKTRVSPSFWFPSMWFLEYSNNWGLTWNDIKVLPHEAALTSRVPNTGTGRETLMCMDRKELLLYSKSFQSYYDVEIHYGSYRGEKVVKNGFKSWPLLICLWYYYLCVVIAANDNVDIHPASSRNRLGLESHCDMVHNYTSFWVPCFKEDILDSFMLLFISILIPLYIGFSLWHKHKKLQKVSK